MTTPTPTPGADNPDNPCDCEGIGGTGPITEATPTTPGPDAGATSVSKLTAVYPIPDCPCSNGSDTVGAGAMINTGGPPAPSLEAMPIVIGGAGKGAPPRTGVLLLIGGAYLAFFVF